MPNETLITEIENLLSEVVALGGENERSQVVPNLTVVNANPTGLDGYVIVSDDRDGDNILAKKVGSIIYSNNDKVNVTFIQGTEPIAGQQGSGSANSGIWEIVPSTSTDIYYDKGDVGIGKSIAPDAALEVLDTSQAQLRLSFEEDIKFADFTLDTNHDLTVKPSSTGQIKLQPTTDSTDFFQVLDADGGTPVLNVDSTNERVGIGLSTPAGKVEIDTATANENGLILKSTDNSNTNKLLSIRLSDDTEYIRANISQAALPTGLVIDTTGVATATRSLPMTVTFDDNNTNNLSGLSGMVFANLNTTDNNLAALIFTGKTDTGAQPAFAALECIFTDHANASKDADIVLVSMRANSFTEQLRMRSDGNLLLGVSSALGDGKIHAYDAISGFKHWKYDGLDGTSRNVIANGAGDVLYRLTGRYVLRDSAGAVASGALDISNGGSSGLVVGGNTVTIAVAGTGATTISRTAGSDTIKVGLWLLWL